MRRHPVRFGNDPDLGIVLSEQELPGIPGGARARSRMCPRAAPYPGHHSGGGPVTRRVLVIASEQRQCSQRCHKSSEREEWNGHQYHCSYRAATVRELPVVFRRGQHFRGRVAVRDPRQALESLLASHILPANLHILEWSRGDPNPRPPAVQKLIGIC